jgi:hypothetical protein
VTALADDRGDGLAHEAHSAPAGVGSIGSTRHVFMKNGHFRPTTPTANRQKPRERASFLKGFGECVASRPEPMLRSGRDLHPLHSGDERPPESHGAVYFPFGRSPNAFGDAIAPRPRRPARGSGCDAGNMSGGCRSRALSAFAPRRTLFCFRFLYGHWRSYRENARRGLRTVRRHGAMVRFTCIPILRGLACHA